MNREGQYHHLGEQAGLKVFSHGLHSHSIYQALETTKVSLIREFLQGTNQCWHSVQKEPLCPCWGELGMQGIWSWEK